MLKEIENLNQIISNLHICETNQQILDNHKCLSGVTLYSTYGENKTLYHILKKKGLIFTRYYAFAEDEFPMFKLGSYFNIENAFALCIHEMILDEVGL